MARFYVKTVEVNTLGGDKEDRKFVFFNHQVDRCGIFDGRAEVSHSKLFPGEYEQFLSSLSPEDKELLAFKGGKK